MSNSKLKVLYGEITFRNRFPSEIDLLARHTTLSRLLSLRDEFVCIASSLAVHTTHVDRPLCACLPQFNSFVISIWSTILTVLIFLLLYSECLRSQHMDRLLIRLHRNLVFLVRACILAYKISLHTMSFCRGMGNRSLGAHMAAGRWTYCQGYSAKSAPQKFDFFIWAHSGVCGHAS